MSKNAVIVAGPMVSTPGEFHKIRVRAGRSFLEKIQRLIQAEKNLVIEVTLAGRGFQRMIRQLKSTGYTVTIVFLFLKSPEMCIARVRNRVMAGGHDVPEEDIVRRFYRSKRNFWCIYKDLVDKWDLFYNSGENLQEVASGQGSRIVVTNEILFALFLGDVK